MLAERMKAKTNGKDVEIQRNLSYFTSIKYDGHLVKIFNGKFYTSNNKPFELPIKFDQPKNSTIFAEFLYNSDGKLGSRGKSAIITTLRTNYAKGEPSQIDFGKVSLVMHDIYDPDRYYNYMDRKIKLQGQVGWDSNDGVLAGWVDSNLVSGEVALAWSKTLINEGWEGAMAILPNQHFMQNKRVNGFIKLKHRPSIDLLCIGTELGKEGTKYSDCIGSLICIDSKGNKVNVGSGLTDYDRTQHLNTYVGKVVEIEYESFKDTYIQPTFIRLRPDKDPDDID